jgi:type II secretory pathway component PulK
MSGQPRDRVALPLPARLQSESGMALLIVLLGLSLVLLVVSEFVQTIRLEAATTTNFRRGFVATHLAEAGYHRALVEILAEAQNEELDSQGRLVFRRADSPATERVEAPPRLDLALGAEHFSCRISDESARINLNRASPDLLRRLLDTVGVERETRDVIVDSILDWISPNESHRLNGAKSDYYLALPVPYRSKNAEFDSVDELLQVRGVTREILYGRGTTPGLADLLTVAGTGAINVNTVEAPVLRALGFAEAEIDLLVAKRPYVNVAAVPGAVRRGTLRTRSDVFRIEAWGGGTASTRTLVAVVRRGASVSGAGLVTPLSWVWHDAAHQAPAAEGPAPR